MAIVDRRASFGLDVARAEAEREGTPATVGEGAPLRAAELAHLLSLLERTGGLENAEWNHLDEAPVEEAGPRA